MTDHWLEIMKEAFEDAGIKGATDEQIGIVASWAEGEHANGGLSSGRNFIPNPLEAKVKDLERQLQIERDMVECPECKGAGAITSQGPIHSTSSQCWRCRGRGRVTL